MDNAYTALSLIEADATTDVAALVSSYQLKPHLLDAIVPQALKLLSNAYVATHNTAPLQTVYVFSRVRGHKTIMQHLPTDARLLEPLLERLNALNGSGMWQAQYALLLWLASLVLTPFELDNLGNNLWQRLYLAGAQYLSVSGIQRDAAAVFVARLLTRKREDQARHVDAYVAQLTKEPALGDLQVLAEVMDRVSTVPPSIHQLLINAAQTSEDEKECIYYSGMSTARLWVKIAGRVALREIGEFAEFVLAECFALLDSKSTRVRMTAAKYIARIAAKLPDEHAEEVCTSLISSLDEDVQYASPDYYNGALIALAEIVRRKLLRNPVIFDQLVATVLEVRGLHFLQDRLSIQIGTNVRDAACYVCWSIFRSVPQLDAGLRTRLFSSLIALAVLDHEVNVRRAAAAALQEGLGRYGSKMDAKEAFFIMEQINFQTVSLLPHCYLEIAPEFCQRPGFFEHFLLHGVLSAQADVRRLAADAISGLQRHVHAEHMIDSLLAVRTQTADSLHGKMLALGSLYTTSKSEYRVQESQELIKEPNDSDLLTEAMLRLLPIAPQRAAILIEMIVTEERHVMSAAKDVCQHLPTRTLQLEVLPACKRRMDACLTHVACIVAMREAPTNVLLQAARLRNPQARAMAVSRLELSDCESVTQLVTALNDYSIDDRGDVGGWVREAALDRVVTLRPEAVKEITTSLWKIASDSRQKLRLKAGKALVDLQHVASLDFETSESYYYSLLRACPESMRELVAQGLAASVGGFNSNMTTAEGSFLAMVRYMDDKDSDWLMQKIMSMDRSSAPKCAVVVRTLKRLVTYGVEVKPWKRALAIAYNTTLVPRQPESLVVEAIDVLAMYAERSPEAVIDRLLKLVKTHTNGNVRQFAADALFECGVEDDILETTDWTRREYQVNAKKLIINM